MLKKKPFALALPAARLRPRRRRLRRRRRRQHHRRHEATTPTPPTARLPRRRRGRREHLRLVDRRAHLRRRRRELLDCGPASAATVDGPGTGDGFALFCAGETDISDASRPIKDEEAAACEDERHRVHRAQGRLRRHLRAHQPGQRRRRVPELRRPLRPHRPGVRGRRQLERRPGAGHRARLDHRAPRRRPRRSRPPARSPAPTTASSRSPSGTSPRPGPRPARSPRTRSRRPATTTRRRPTTPPSSPAWRPIGRPLGWVGFAFAEEAGDEVKELAVVRRAGRRVRRAHAPRRSPTAATRSAASLYIYVNAAKADENPAVAAYVDYYLCDEGIASVERGRLRRPARRPARGHPGRLGGQDHRHPASG